MRGKASEHIQDFQHHQDHPRLCGEKQAMTKINTAQMGSPPPMRGKAYETPVSELVYGITPAYAGKRPLCFRTGIVQWDHPRLCGEKFPASGLVKRL